MIVLYSSNLTRGRGTINSYSIKSSGKLPLSALRGETCDWSVWFFKQKHRKFSLMKLSTEPARRKKRGGACTTRHWKQSCREQRILESLSTLRSASLESKRERELCGRKFTKDGLMLNPEKFRGVKESSPPKKLREVSVEWPNTDQSSSKIHITNCTLAKADP